MTGRGAGFCAGNDRPGFAEPGPGFARSGRGFRGRRFAGRSFGRGFAGRGGAGRGGYRWRNWFYAADVPWAETADETEALKAQAEWLRGELDAIDQRLQELDQQE
jgi:hypothetical protein